MFDVRKLLTEQFHNPARLIAVLRAYRLPAPSLGAAEKWFSRSSVPSDWLAIIMLALEIENGGPISLRTYISVGRS